jgi:hypothetical protein
MQYKSKGARKQSNAAHSCGAVRSAACSHFVVKQQK